jgi:hypothetical protein
MLRHHFYHDSDQDEAHMSIEFGTLAEVLTTIFKLQDGWLYMQGNDPWLAQSNAIAYPQYGQDLEALYPEFVLAQDLRRTVDISAVRDIVTNAMLQKPNVQIDDLVRAFNHYWAMDEFLEFEDALKFRPVRELIESVDSLPDGIIIMWGSPPWDQMSKGAIYENDDVELNRVWALLSFLNCHETMTTAALQRHIQLAFNHNPETTIDDIVTLLNQRQLEIRKPIEY